MSLTDVLTVIIDPKLHFVKRLLLRNRCFFLAHPGSGEPGPRSPLVSESGHGRSCPDSNIAAMACAVADVGLAVKRRIRE